MTAVAPARPRRVIFAGTPAFAAQALGALSDAGHDIVLVLTRPDQPAGRGQKLRASEVKQLAQARGMRIEQPVSLRDAAAQRLISDMSAEVMVVAAYGLILPAAVLQIPRHGCINIHASLLPRWRGAAPIVRAIQAGDRRTGITIMQMDAGLDTGPMLLQQAEPIHHEDDAASLHDRLAVLGAKLIVAALAQLEQLQPRPQPSEGVSYAHKLAKAEAALDWRRSAVQLADQVRAFRPFPIATATHLKPDGAVGLRVWGVQAESAHTAAAPGTILRAEPGGVAVQCSKGVLTLTKLQKPSGSVLDCASFLRGYAMAAGERFALPSD